MTLAALNLAAGETRSGRFTGSASSMHGMGREVVAREQARPRLISMTSSSLRATVLSLYLHLDHVRSPALSHSSTRPGYTRCPTGPSDAPVGRCPSCGGASPSSRFSCLRHGPSQSRRAPSTCHPTGYTSLLVDLQTRQGLHASGHKGSAHFRERDVDARPASYTATAWNRTLTGPGPNTTNVNTGISRGGLLRQTQGEVLL